jgi:4-hydroxyphenylacetate 3-monooxygenase/4-hydroxybutyryl-CoA dehydratase/vinylacetyl-CoA-Delta-isomerase
MVRSVEDYLESLKSMRPNVYFRGKLIKRDHKILEPSINLICRMFELANEPKYRDLLTVNGKIDRLTYIPQSPDDLLKEQEMIRFYTHKTSICAIRCGGQDCMCALSIVTYDIDKELGTDYHARFRRFLREFQEKDLVVPITMTDVKGDRSLRPHQQLDPDVYVRVVEARSDGIIVSGIKHCITAAAQAEKLVVIPTRAMTEKDKDWSISFVVPADAEGVKMIVSPANPPEQAYLKAPYANYGFSDCVVIFDRVFVPWDDVFLYKEPKYATQLARLTALYHRHGYTGCKPGLGDVIVGAAALAAEYNNVADRETVWRKIIEVAIVAELAYAAGIAAAVTSTKHPSGTQIPSEIYVNCSRYLSGMSVFHEYQILVDLAGGLAATLVSEEDLVTPAQEVANHIETYLRRKEGVPIENIHRLWRFIHDRTCTRFGGHWLAAAFHGGGSPIMEEIAIRSSYDFELRKKIVKELLGIKE